MLFPIPLPDWPQTIRILLFLCVWNYCQRSHWKQVPVLCWYLQYCLMQKPRWNWLFHIVTIVMNIYSIYVFEYMLSFFVYSSLVKLAMETSHLQRVQSRLPSFPGIIYVVHFLRQIPEAIKAIMIYFQHRYCIFDIYNILDTTKPFINDIILWYYLLWIVFVQ